MHFTPRPVKKSLTQHLRAEDSVRAVRSLMEDDDDNTLESKKALNTDHHTKKEQPVVD